MNNLTHTMLLVALFTVSLPAVADSSLHYKAGLEDKAKLIQFQLISNNDQNGEPNDEDQETEDENDAKDEYSDKEDRSSDTDDDKDSYSGSSDEEGTD